MDITAEEILKLEKQLDSFDWNIRNKALLTLEKAAETKLIQIKPMREIANLHCHSFYSYNGYGYSPSHLAWLGKKHGIKFMGVVDFDVLDAVDEFLDACEMVGVRGIAGIETRVFIPEFKDVEINSPGEPGVLYHMGTGFTSSRAPSDASIILNNLKKRVSERNQDMLSRINQFLAPLKVDYVTDVLPLTPSGNATERHMVQVLAKKAIELMDDPAHFWGSKFNIPRDDIEIKMRDENEFNNFLRSKLMKRGGVGYVQPTATSFPTVEEFHTIMNSSGALPCSAWLDGISAGEQRIDELLQLLIGKGVSAFNIVPDRNWNITDTAIKKKKLQKLYEVVALSQSFDLPVLVGTEMNKFGQKFVDDFNAPELEPVKDVFLKGAEILYGHTQLQRYWGVGYKSTWAERNFPNRKKKNDFYQQVGQIIQPGTKSFQDDLSHYDPDAVLLYLKLD